MYSLTWRETSIPSEVHPLAQIDERALCAFYHLRNQGDWLPVSGSINSSECEQIYANVNGTCFYKDKKRLLGNSPQISEDFVLNLFFRLFFYPYCKNRANYSIIASLWDILKSYRLSVRFTLKLCKNTDYIILDKSLPHKEITRRQLILSDLITFIHSFIHSFCSQETRQELKTQDKTNICLLETVLTHRTLPSDEFIYPKISVAEALSRCICVLSLLWHRWTYGLRGGDERKKEGKGTERRQGDTRNHRPRELNSGYPHDYEAKVTRPLLCPNITVFISIHPTESSVNEESERRALSDPPSIEREHFDILSNESLLNFPAIQSLLLSLAVLLSFKKGETPQTRFSLRCILAPSFLSFHYPT